MELFAPVRAATLDFERDGAQDAGPLSLVDASPSKAQQHGCTLRSAHTWTDPGACKGLNPQAEQLACDTRVRSGSCIIKNSGIAELDLLQQRATSEQQVARRPAHVEHGSIRS